MKLEIILPSKGSHNSKKKKKRQMSYSYLWALYLSVRLSKIKGTFQGSMTSL